MRSDGEEELGKQFPNQHLQEIFIPGFGNIASGKYTIFYMWRIINEQGDLGIFGGVFQAWERWFIGQMEYQDLKIPTFCLQGFRENPNRCFP